MLEVCKGRKRVYLEKVIEQSMFSKFQTESNTVRARGPCVTGVQNSRNVAE